MSHRNRNDRVAPKAWICEYMAVGGTWWPVLPFHFFQFRYQAEKVTRQRKLEDETGRYRTIAYERRGASSPTTKEPGEAPQEKP